MGPRKVGSGSGSASSSTVSARKCPWSREEDFLLAQHVQAYGERKWSDLPHRAGLVGRSGQSCRFRWKNYLRPDIKHEAISSEEEDLIIRLHRLVGNRWSLIAGRVPGRTDNQIKNFWYTQKRKKQGAQSGVESQTSIRTAQNPAHQIDCVPKDDNNINRNGFEELDIFGEQDSLLLYPLTLVDSTGTFAVEPSYSELLEMLEINYSNANCNHLWSP